MVRDPFKRGVLLRAQSQWLLECGDVEQVLQLDGWLWERAEWHVDHGAAERGRAVEVKRGHVLGANEQASGGSADVSSSSLQKFRRDTFT